MWKITKEQGQDLSFATYCLLSAAINLQEFKLWLEKVVLDMPIDNIHFYIFDLIDLKEGVGDIYNILDFVPNSDLSKDQDDALTGIAFLRGIDVYDPPVSKEKALKALKKHPETFAKFLSLPTAETQTQVFGCFRPKYLLILPKYPLNPPRIPDNQASGPPFRRQQAHLACWRLSTGSNTSPSGGFAHSL